MTTAVDSSQGPATGATGTRPRGRRLRRSAVAVGVTGVLLAAAACGGSSGGSGGAKAAGGSSSGSGSSGGIAAGPIKIGMVAGLSGPSASIGNYQKAVQTALASYVNAHGGIAGHQVQLIIENSEGDPAKAVAAARSLVNQGVVATVYTGLGTEGLEQVLAVLAKANVVSLSPEPLAKYGDPSQHPNFFSTNPIDPNATRAIAEFAKKRGFDKVGQLGDSTDFSASLEKNFSDNAGKVGVSIVKTVDYPTTATSMTTQLSQLRAAGAQTLGLWCEVGCGQVFDSLRQIGWKPNILTTEVVYYVGFSSVKDYGTTTYADCPIAAPKSGQVDPKLAGIITYVADRAGGQTVADQGIPLNADSWLILKAAMEKANSTDGKKVIAAIESFKDMSFSDPRVKYTFSDTNHAGFDAANPSDIPMCDLSGLGQLKLPIAVS